MAESRTKMNRAELQQRYASGERDFRRLDLSGVDLSRADLTNAGFADADLTRAKLSRATLTGADLSGADLRWADLTFAHLHAHLRDTNLQFADLSRADLRGNDLGGSNLGHANLSDALLADSSLIGINLSGAELNFTDLVGANLTGANLRGAVLHRCDLTRAIFERARCSGTFWVDVDLSSSVGLAEIEHSSPSSVGIDTLVLSGGAIPDVFLRGCGVPEHIIELQRALVQGVAPLQFYSCFISYSHQDQEFAQRLRGRLQEEGLRIWYAPEDLRGGGKVHDQIDDAIRLHDKLLLVLSTASMSSEWVATEISKARRRERKEGKRVLFPIRLVDFEAMRDWECFDADAGKDSAREIREYFIPDFSIWKDHDAFETALARLLNDLRASAE
jgi:uncharacterized protein YjbI with pentapeptide repeats